MARHRNSLSLPRLEYEARVEEVPGEEIVERVDIASVVKYGWQERMIHPFRIRRPTVLRLHPLGD